jgi:hypothetical protein
MAASNLTVEIRVGPTMRTALDVLELAGELLELIPQWHEAERRELDERRKCLAEIVRDNLIVRGKLNTPR